MNKDDRRSGIAGRSGGLSAFFPALNKEDDERGGKHGCGCNVLDNLNGKIVSVTKQITKLFNTGVDHSKCNYKLTQNGEQRPFCGRKIVKATENENIKCRNKVKSHMTFAFYGKVKTSECTFKTFDLLFHTP